VEEAVASGSGRDAVEVPADGAPASSFAVGSEDPLVEPVTGSRSRTGRRRLLLALLLVLAGGALVAVSFVGVPWKGGAAKVRYLTATAVRGDVRTTVSGTGSVEPTATTDLAFSAGSPSVSSGGAGGSTTSTTPVVSKVYVQAGDEVTAGERLAVLDRTMYQLAVDSAQDAYDAAVAQRDDPPTTTTQSGSSSATTQTQSDEALQQAVSEAAVTLQQAKAALAGTTVVAPVAGVVDSVGFEAGVAPASDAAITLRSTGMQVQVDVSEDDISSVKVGQPASVKVVALGQTVHGTVTSTDPDTAGSDQGTGSSGGSGGSTSSTVTFPVLVRLATLPTGLRSGMSAEVSITTASRTDVVTVPVTAVQGSGDSATVRVLRSGKLASLPVKIGMATSSTVEVTSGLTAGTKVVTGVINPQASTTTSSSQSRSGLTGGGFGGAGGFAGGGNFRTFRAGSGGNGGGNRG
jgi:macrolide-specific efflux system membrane fusion protein